MLDLVVTATRGNTAGRYFPVGGHFGLTPVVLAGTAATVIPSFGQPLVVSSITATVRCVETRSGGPLVETLENTLWQTTQVLFQSDDSAELGAWSAPFRIVIPTDAASQAQSTQHFKGWRTAWRFDVTVNHKHIPHVGDRIVKGFDLRIIKYIIPASIPPSTVETTVGTDAHTCLVRVDAPRGVLGPEDVMRVSVHARPYAGSAPASAAPTLKKVSVVLERAVEYLEDRRRLFLRSSTPEDELRAMVSASSEAESNACTVDMVLPKRGTTWDTGETCRTRFVSVSFCLRVKVHLKAGKSTRDFQLDPIPILMASVSSGERDRAMNALVDKQQRRQATKNRKSLYIHQGTIDISESIVPRKRSPSPAITATPGYALKPILLSPDQSGPPPQQSISFVFPSLPPHGNPLLAGLPRLDQVSSPTETANDYWHGYQHSARRVSTSGSEGDALQPPPIRKQADFRPTLPSLDALGLGLPKVPRLSYQRPSTAPALISTTQSFTPPRSNTSYAGQAPPPQQTTRETIQDQEQSVFSPHTFAFCIQGD